MDKRKPQPTEKELKELAHITLEDCISKLSNNYKLSNNFEVWFVLKTAIYELNCRVAARLSEEQNACTATDVEKAMQETFLKRTKINNNIL